jgi:hypothetical protein
MPDIISRLTISAFVFTIGVSIGAIYTPGIITFTKSVVDVNLDKQQQENKPSPLPLKKNNKKRFV